MTLLTSLIPHDDGEEPLGRDHSAESGDVLCILCARILPRIASPGGDQCVLNNLASFCSGFLLDPTKRTLARLGNREGRVLVSLARSRLGSLWVAVFHPDAEFLPAGPPTDVHSVQFSFHVCLPVKGWQPLHVVAVSLSLHFSLLISKLAPTIPQPCKQSFFETSSVSNLKVPSPTVSSVTISSGEFY